MFDGTVLAGNSHSFRVFKKYVSHRLMAGSLDLTLNSPPQRLPIEHEIKTLDKNTVKVGIVPQI
jgi:hypothetical protein